MAIQQKTAATVAMKGGGYYSQSTQGAKHVIDNASGMLLDAVKALPDMPADHVIQIADYGTADGGTSFQTIRNIVAALRGRFPDNQILVTYTDLASNDFSSLFKMVQGIDGFSPDTYYKEFENVFVHACGIGFHYQLLPGNTLDIGFSATAMHYVSEKPCEIPDHVHMVGTSGDVLKQFSDRAAADWEAILLARAAEMRSGGRLVIMNFGQDEQGRYLGNTDGVNMFNTFDMHWSAMRDEGLITDDEYLNASFSQYYRTVEEFCAPFKNPESAVSKAGLKLTSAHTGVVKCPYAKNYADTKETMSAREFAKSYIPTLRSWSETVFANGLDQSRSADERAALVDAFYQRYEDMVAENPEGHAMDYVHCYLAIEKL